MACFAGLPCAAGVRPAPALHVLTAHLPATHAQGHPEEVYACLFLQPPSASSGSSGGAAAPQRLLTASGEALFLWDVATQRLLHQGAPPPPPPGTGPGSGEHQGAQRADACWRTRCFLAFLLPAVCGRYGWLQAPRPPAHPLRCSRPRSLNRSGARALASRLPVWCGGAARRPPGGRRLQRRPAAAVGAPGRRLGARAAVHAAVEPGGWVDGGEAQGPRSRVQPQGRSPACISRQQCPVCCAPHRRLPLQAMGADCAWGPNSLFCAVAKDGSVIMMVRLAPRRAAGWSAGRHGSTL